MSSTVRQSHLNLATFNCRSVKSSVNEVKGELNPKGSDRRPTFVGQHLSVDKCWLTNVGGEHVTRPTFVGGHLVSANKCRPSDRTTDICWPTKMQ